MHSTAFTFPARQGACLRPRARVIGDTREQHIQAFGHRRLRGDRVAKSGVCPGHHRCDRVFEELVNGVVEVVRRVTRRSLCLLMARVKRDHTPTNGRAVRSRRAFTWVSCARDRFANGAAGGHAGRRAARVGRTAPKSSQMRSFIPVEATLVCPSVWPRCSADTPTPRGSQTQRRRLQHEQADRVRRSHTDHPAVASPETSLR